MKKKIICTGVLAAMLIGCVSVSAFPGMGMGNPMKGFGRPFETQSENFELPEKPAMPKLTEEQKAEMQTKAIEDLNKQLEEGKITQEEYNDLLTKIENGDFVPCFKGKNRGPRHHCGPGFEKPENITDTVEE